MKKKYLEICKITGTHGVHGELRCEPWCDSPAFMKRLKTLYSTADGAGSLTVTACRPHGNMVILRLEGVDNIEDAAALRGRLLYMNRDDCPAPENGWFIQDLIGCEVYDADNTGLCYGELTDVSETGANDVWHITSGEKQTLIPAIKDVVVSVDVDEGKILIRPLRGLFDDD